MPEADAVRCLGGSIHGVSSGDTLAVPDANTSVHGGGGVRSLAEFADLLEAWSGLYAPFIHPWSTGRGLYFNLSLWSAYSCPNPRMSCYPPGGRVTVTVTVVVLVLMTVVLVLTLMLVVGTVTVVVLGGAVLVSVIVTVSVPGAAGAGAVVAVGVIGVSVVRVVLAASSEPVRITAQMTNTSSSTASAPAANSAAGVRYQGVGSSGGPGGGPPYPCGWS